MSNHNTIFMVWMEGDDNKNDCDLICINMQINIYEYVISLNDKVMVTH